MPHGLVIGFAVTTVSPFLRCHDLESHYTRPAGRVLALERTRRENGGVPPAGGLEETITRSGATSDPVDDQR